MHRNGVNVLGTFIIESQTPDIERLLEENHGEYVIARRLAELAKICGFDGWLLNIEAEFPFSIKDPTGKLLAFIRNLKRLLGSERKVIWYDALTNDNEVKYQNSLTLRNVEFALAAGALFTNYKWSKTELLNSLFIAQSNGLDTSKVYFGIDVWAQNTNMPGPRRVTFPKNGGGGTLTGLVSQAFKIITRSNNPK